MLGSKLFFYKPDGGTVFSYRVESPSGVPAVGIDVHYFFGDDIKVICAGILVHDIKNVKIDGNDLDSSAYTIDNSSGVLLVNNTFTSFISLGDEHQLTFEDDGNNGSVNIYMLL